MLKRWSATLGAYAAWLLLGALALVVIALGANFIESYSITVLKEAEWTEVNTVQAKYTVRIIIQVYYVIAGILWLGFFLLMEHIMITTGLPQKLVLRRGAFALGVELLIMAVLHGAMMTYLPAYPYQIGLTAFEALAGGTLIYLSRRKKAAIPAASVKPQ